MEARETNKNDRTLSRLILITVDLSAIVTLEYRVMTHLWHLSERCWLPLDLEQWWWMIQLLRHWMWLPQRCSHSSSVTTSITRIDLSLHHHHHWTAIYSRMDKLDRKHCCRCIRMYPYYCCIGWCSCQRCSRWSWVLRSNMARLSKDSYDNRMYWCLWERMSN